MLLYDDLGRAAEIYPAVKKDRLPRKMFTQQPSICLPKRQQDYRLNQASSHPD